jgi:hypothetical protein
MSRHKFRFPKPAERKQRSTMNAFQHPRTGNNMLMQAHEVEIYQNLTDKLHAEFQPKTEMERQLAQKIIDTNFRLNRLSTIENNMLNFEMMFRETGRNEDDRTEVMHAQAKAWKDEAKSFDILGRYEARLARQLLLYKKELERLVDMRLPAALEEVRQPAAQFATAAHSTVPLAAAACVLSSAQTDNSNDLNSEMASFGRNRVPPLPPPARLRL